MHSDPVIPIPTLHEKTRHDGRAGTLFDSIQSIIYYCTVVQQNPNPHSTNL
jgi:hypothetical protein